MFGWGITLIILGVLSFVLPAMDIQFTLISLVADSLGSETVAGVVFIIVGGILSALGLKGRNSG